MPPTTNHTLRFNQTGVLSDLLLPALLRCLIRIAGSSMLRAAVIRPTRHRVIRHGIIRHPSAWVYLARIDTGGIRFARIWAVRAAALRPDTTGDRLPLTRLLLRLDLSDGCKRRFETQISPGSFFGIRYQRSNDICSALHSSYGIADRRRYPRIQLPCLAPGVTGLNTRRKPWSNYRLSSIVIAVIGQHYSYHYIFANVCR